ncbi:MAG: tetratricopeptide repeat protein [Deltaproteobacteria bacterium]|nr:tetratricopeptide repeat protein [Candidatus Anaeroferrophillus wilburensis]MBN2889746.1 tetratricopeptide repeat protein [Deltaproteobacteria bacterium]
MSAMFFAKKDRGENLSTRIRRLQDQLQKNPDSFHLRVKLAEAYIQSGDQDTGISQLMKIAERDSREGSVDKAIAVYKLILRYDPGNLKVKDVLSTVYSYKGLSAEAAELGDLLKNEIEPEPIDAGFLPQISVAELERLSAISTLLPVKTGDAIITQGEYGDTLYIILEGEVEVYSPDSDNQDYEAMHLKAGNFFGEMSVLGGGPRVATVRAVSDCRLLAIKKEQFSVIEEQFPQLQQQIIEGYHQRMIDVVLASLIFFQRIPAQRRKEIVSRLHIRPMVKGDTIVREGQQNKSLYIILVGEVEVYLHSNEHAVHLADLGRGNFFGEISMITGRLAIASVVAKSDGLLAAMDRTLLDEIAMQFPHFLRKVMDRLKQRNQDTMIRMIEHYHH